MGKSTQILIQCSNTRVHKDKKQYVQPGSLCAINKLCGQCMTNKTLVEITLRKEKCEQPDSQGTPINADNPAP